MFISRIDASRIACNLSDEEIRQFSNCPQMDAVRCWKWCQGLTGYIESVYDGQHTSFDDIVTDFISNINRKFQTEEGKVIDYCQLLGEYLKFMCHPQNSGKKFTLKRFKSFIARYTEI